nr:hypothetical protein [Tanacetum cinerariifolium]
RSDQRKHGLRSERELESGADGGFVGGGRAQFGREGVGQGLEGIVRSSDACVMRSHAAIVRGIASAAAKGHARCRLRMERHDAGGRV